MDVLSLVQEHLNGLTDKKLSLYLDTGQLVQTHKWRLKLASTERMDYECEFCGHHVIELVKWSGEVRSSKYYETCPGPPD